VGLTLAFFSLQALVYALLLVVEYDRAFKGSTLTSFSPIQAAIS
jgi:hypothetical protein